MKLILASGSPRRRELMAEAGYVFEVVVSPAEELHDAGMRPGELCETNAEGKAVAVADEWPDAVVVGADTLVWLDREPLGKPRTMDEARAMMRKLSGRGHVVCTGVCVVVPGPERRVVRFHEETVVVFRELSDAEIDAYFALVDPMDKAGAYGVQEHGERIVADVRGSFSNVVGLPVERLAAVLWEVAEIGV
jgi:septum formation protein